MESDWLIRATTSEHQLQTCTFTYIIFQAECDGIIQSMPDELANVFKLYICKFREGFMVKMIAGSYIFYIFT